MTIRRAPRKKWNRACGRSGTATATGATRAKRRARARARARAHSIKEEASTFDHEKLDVYKVAIQFATRADEIVEALPRGRRYIADQLQRASLSIVLNIAEGAGKFSKPDKACFYTRARGSTTECAAVLDVAENLRIMTSAAVEKDKVLLERIDRMLTKLIKALQEAGPRVDPAELNISAPGPVPGPGPGFFESGPDQ